MAKSFKELGRKAEALIEQGNEADNNVSSCQARVTSAQRRVAAAQRELEEASQTDEEGNPVGNVGLAKEHLQLATEQLAATERSLSSAKGEAKSIREQKNAHVNAIETHNRIERSNLAKLERLKSMAFGENASVVAEGMAERLNEAERIRVELLRSMGIEASAEQVSASGGVGNSGFKAGGFASLDLSGQVQGHHGGGSSEGGISGVGLAAPVGGGLGPMGIVYSDSQMEAGSGQMLGSENRGSGTQSNRSPEEQVGDGLSSLESENPMQLGENSGNPEGSLTGIQRSAHNGGRLLRTPAQVLADMKKTYSEFFMNNFSADLWKQNFPESIYQARLDRYRKGIADVVGEAEAAKLSEDDLISISRIQNQAFTSGCNLTRSEIAELYRNACDHQGNFVTSSIETKMDHVLQDKAHNLLTEAKYSKEVWKDLSITEKKDTLQSLLVDMNSLFGTTVSTDIDFFYEISGSRGAYSSESNCVRINEYLLEKDTSYQLTQTMIHEMRQAFQHHAVSNPRSVIISNQTIKTWEDNFADYKSPNRGHSFEEYLSQPVEWDAKNFAKQHADIMGINPEYGGSWL